MKPACEYSASQVPVKAYLACHSKYNTRSTQAMEQNEDKLVYNHDEEIQAALSAGTCDVEWWRRWNKEYVKLSGFLHQEAGFDALEAHIEFALQALKDERLTRGPKWNEFLRFVEQTLDETKQLRFQRFGGVISQSYPGGFQARARMPESISNALSTMTGGYSSVTTRDDLSESCSVM